MTMSSRPLVSWIVVVLASLVMAFGTVEVTRGSLEHGYTEALATEVGRRAIEVTAQTLNGNVMGAISSLGLVNRTVKAVVRGLVSPEELIITEPLEAIGHSYQASGVFIVNGNGIVQSSWDSGGKSSSGLDIKFRPYFKIAMAGNQNIYAAVSLATGERALYFAAPVYSAPSSQAPVIGVAVARLGLDRVDSVLTGWAGPALLLSPQKVAFASNRGEWVSHLAGERTPEQIQAIRALKQFGQVFESGTPKLLPFDIDGDTVVIDSHRYAVARAPVRWNDPQGDWTLVLLGDLDAAMPLSHKASLGGMSGAITFVLGTMVLAWRRRLRLANQARRHAEGELKDYAGRLELDSAVKSFLAEVSADLHKASSLAEFAGTFMRHVTRRVGADYGAFYWFDEDRQMLVPVGGHGALPADLATVALGQGLVGQCAKDKAAIAVSGSADTPIRIVWGAGMAVPNSVLLLPLVQAGRLLGVVVLAALHSLDGERRGMLDAMLPLVAMNLEILDRNLGTQHQAEALQRQQIRLRETEAWYRGIIEAAPDGLLVCDEDGVVVIANPQVEAMFGYDTGSLAGCKVEDLVPAAGRVHHVGLREDFTRNGTARAMSMLNKELRGVRRNGDDFPVEVGLSRLPALGGGGVCVCASVRDITERRRNERALVDERERLQRILDTSPVSIAFSTKGNIQFANPRFTETFGVKVGDPSPQLYVDSDERDDLIACLKRDGIVENREIRMYNARHQVRHMLVTYLPIAYDGEDGILGWIMDVTERKPVEAAPPSVPPPAAKPDPDSGAAQGTPLPDLDPDIFDFERLGPVYHWNTAKLRGVLSRFLDDSEAKVAGMEDAVSRGDLAAIRQFAHGLKGSGNTAGAMRLGTLAANVETLALDGNAEALGMFIPLLAPTLTELREALSPFLTSSP